MPFALEANTIVPLLLAAQLLSALETLLGHSARRSAARFRPTVHALLALVQPLLLQGCQQMPAPHFPPEALPLLLLLSLLLPIFPAEVGEGHAMALAEVLQVLHATLTREATGGSVARFYPFSVLWCAFLCSGCQVVHHCSL